MNERIRELAERAVLAVDIVTGNETLDDELAKMYIPDCFAEKFAQLIVRECAIIAFEEWQHNSTSGESAILKHFGVEQ